MENISKGSSSVLRVIAIALNGGSKSKYIVKWALEKFGDIENVSFKLIHVYSKINGVPTPMGNLIPFSHVRDDVVVAYKKEIEWQKTQLILPYQRMLIRNKVLAEVVLYESDEIWNAISTELAKGEIKDLVIGASSNSMFARKFRGQSISSLISEWAPSYSTIFVISKGKLEALRPAQTIHQTQRTSVEYDSSSAPGSTFTSPRFTNSSSETISTSSESSLTPPPRPPKYVESGAKVKNESDHPSKSSPGHTRVKPAFVKNVDDSAIDLRSRSQNSESRFSDQASTSSCHSISSIEDQQKDINSELEKLRIELRHIRGVYSMAQNETQDATRKLSDLNRLRHEEGVKLRQIKEKEEIAKVLARLETEKFEAAKREAEWARECALRESFQRREAELKGAQDAKEKRLLKKEIIAGRTRVDHYQTFTWDEIVKATCSFSDELKIGEGSLGTVYKCRLHHTAVAVKVLHSKEGVKSKQFLQQLEMLSKIRHPHLLLHLGACPEHGCLVYEYMKNGTLQDRLLRKNNTPPIPWYERFRIVSEVASALAFLHSNKPSPIIHGALKTSNILLDHHLVSKIFNTGWPKNPSEQPSCMRDDICGLGTVILLLLTALKPSAAGITQVVAKAIKEGRLVDVLDTDAGRWPFRETAEMALLGLRCAAELRDRDPPDLQSKVLPVVERLQDVADKARDLAAGFVLVAPPTHFICPILQDVMEDPCVASDGYTYDRKAIELWIKDNDTSPTTNFPLENKHIIPNYSLLYAIMEWKSKRKIRTEKSRSKLSS